MWRLEEKYNSIEQILVWDGRRYTRTQLEQKTMPELRCIYAELEGEQISKLY